MGHGSPNCANLVYAALDNMLKGMGYGNFFLGSMEGTPSLNGIIHQITQKTVKKVHLAPSCLLPEGMPTRIWQGARRILGNPC